MPPDQYSQMIKHLTRRKIQNPFIPDSAIERPKRILEIEAFQDFNKRNPKADGGMLVQPGFGGTRQGYAKSKKKTSDYNREYYAANKKLTETGKLAAERAIKLRNFIGNKKTI